MMLEIMLDHTAAHVTLDGILMMVVQLGSMLRNVHSPVMVLFVTMPLATILMDHSNVLSPLTTQVLHVLTTTDAKMVPIIVMKMHHVPILTVASHVPVTQASKVKVMSVPISMNALPNMPIRTSVDQTPIVRIPPQDISAHAQTVSIMYQPIKKTVVKIFTNVPLTTTTTATLGPQVPTQYHFTPVPVISQVTSIMSSSASMLINVMTFPVVTTASMVTTVTVIILMTVSISLVLVVTISSIVW